MGRVLSDRRFVASLRTLASLRETSQ